MMPAKLASTETRSSPARNSQRLRSVHADRAPTDAHEFAANDDLSSDEMLPGFAVRDGDLFENSAHLIQP